ncbi:phosphoribosylaminoimidazolesuccinocarboxamide synthase [Synechococcus sp. PCC 7336]|uniref:phosphoribosylaminoimidazolesuccinocarboxamide synthase n=1 Tax=Synechococcus sp. PCC 7336 TaxID=195250 RepID=UPI00034B2E89|nr:phosphoribosylaminoimidazolesuccinocarboxamide synthase [Synechococcus sp. PCC 7336]
MSDATLLYEGKAKRIYATDRPGILRCQYKDDATAFNAQKKGQIAGKGEVNCTVAALLFRYLEGAGIATHFVGQTGSTEMAVRAVTILPVEVVVRNRAAGTLCKRLGLERGKAIAPPLVEFFYKNDDLGDPLLTTDHIELLNLATPEQVQVLRQQALAIDTLLQQFFLQCQLELIDFKLEFGTDANGDILLADEISPDTCRLWNLADERVLDKDLFRFDLGDPVAGYREVLERVQAVAGELGQ